MRNIVKVQRAIVCTTGYPVLVYNEDRSIMMELPEIKGLKKEMGDNPLKAFFYFHLEKGEVNGRKGKYVVLDGKAPYQNW